MKFISVQNFDTFWSPKLENEWI